MRIFRSLLGLAVLATVFPSPGVVAAPNPTAENQARRIVGNWYDGGPGCAAIGPGRDTRTINLRIWYCEAGRQSSAPVTLQYERTVGAYVHELTGLQLKVISPQRIRIISSETIRGRLGERSYLADDVQDYARQ